MTLLKVQPDKAYSIVEERLRFSAPADLPESAVPFFVARDLWKSIEILEKHRGWRFMDRVPDRIKFCGKPCCSRVALGLPGQPLSIRFERSAFQGDTDDAHNFGELSDPDRRIEEDGLIDWVAICHFWQPGVWVEEEEINEFKNLGEKDGFVHRDNMPDRTPLSQKDLAAAAGQEVWHRAAEEDSNDGQRVAEGASGIVLTGR